jgi:hypothetical protein
MCHRPAACDAIGPRELGSCLGGPGDLCLQTGSRHGLGRRISVFARRSHGRRELCLDSGKDSGDRPARAAGRRLHEHLHDRLPVPAVPSHMPRGVPQRLLSLSLPITPARETGGPLGRRFVMNLVGGERGGYRGPKAARKNRRGRTSSPPTPGGTAGSASTTRRSPSPSCGRSGPSSASTRRRPSSPWTRPTPRSAWPRRAQPHRAGAG